MKKKVCNKYIMLTILTIVLFSILIYGSMHFVKADSSIEYTKSFKTIEIEYGDTLECIAEKYAISEANFKEYIQEVKDINNLKDDTIHAGCYLMIPIFEKNQSSLVMQN